MTSRLGARFRRPGRPTRTLSVDPFAVLGLDCGADLTDDEVCAVWRRIAVGDAGGWAHEVAVRLGRGRPVRLARGRPVRLARVRPVRLALRVIVAAIAAASAILVTGHDPAGPALVAGAATWLVLTGRRDLGSRVASAGTRAGRGLRRGADQPGSWPVATGRDGSDDQADQEPT
jgi:hypothetical protein